MGFRVNKIREHILWEKENDESNAFTVLIGNNGCGKTELLKDTCNYYQSLYVEALASRRQNVSSAVYYVKENLSLWPIIGKEFKHPIPRKLIAASTSQFEKFQDSWKTKRDIIPNGFYAYVGSKPYLPTLSPSVRIASKAIEQLLGTEDRIEPRKQEALTRFLSKFNFGKKLALQFDLTFPKADLEKLAASETHISSTLEPETQLILRQAYEEYESSELTEMLQTCEAISHSPSFVLAILRSSFNLIHIAKNENYPFSKRTIAKLLRSGLISLASIQTVHEKETGVPEGELNLDDSAITCLSKRSSGEQCLFLIFMGIISSIEDNALICIDEPEISLHPQWQEKFVDILNDSFSSYKGCHFIIATHSPLIVSDISSSNCCVYDMVNHKLIDARPHKERSADYQLATLFHNPGNNNEYLITQIIEVLDCVCKTENPPEETLANAHWLLNFESQLEEHDKVSVLLRIMRSTLQSGGHL
ncbi:ATP-binding protein [Vibrio parahaemolyticus]|nr:AAA family ATPase [Vibrio parahaemolyticus]HCZ9285049.1 ATP-binding protein [Vibrio alginolyticus]EJG0325269.1 ATP-binding protein [Vibrio parahaemolyticus]MBE3722409.1 ATP-binding protein [Vibrio parahaemolyticus]MBE4244889.1 ATP-binding protein [Vibrio parahaemolyticus]OUJ50985.1 ATP-binding protein [Vibrio parahaemolyticus]